MHHKSRKVGFFRITTCLSLQELHFLTQFISAGLKIDDRLTLQICFWLEAKIGVLLFLYFLTAGSWQAAWEEKQGEGEKEGILDNRGTLKGYVSKSMVCVYEINNGEMKSISHRERGGGGEREMTAIRSLRIRYKQ